MNKAKPYECNAGHTAISIMNRERGYCVFLAENTGTI